MKKDDRAASSYQKNYDKDRKTMKMQHKLDKLNLRHKAATGWANDKSAQRGFTRARRIGSGVIGAAHGVHAGLLAKESGMRGKHAALVGAGAGLASGLGHNKLFKYMQKTTKRSSREHYLKRAPLLKDRIARAKKDRKKNR